MRIVVQILPAGCLCLSGLPAMSAAPAAVRPVHTCSIVVRDPDTGRLGVAAKAPRRLLALNTAYNYINMGNHSLENGAGERARP